MRPFSLLTILHESIQSDISMSFPGVSGRGISRHGTRPLVGGSSSTSPDEVTSPFSNQNLPIVYFDNSKDPLKSLNNGYKKLYRKFKPTHKFVSCKDVITSARLQGVKAVILPAPQEDLDPQEIETL